MLGNMFHLERTCFFYANSLTFIKVTGLVLGRARSRASAQARAQQLPRA